MFHNGERVETVIFDWSGTISDDRLMVYHANMKIREDHGFSPISFEEFLAGIKLSPAEAFAEMGIVGTNEELLSLYTAAVHEVKIQGIHPVAYKDAVECLLRLRQEGVEVAVLSSHPEEHLHSEAELFGIGQHFHCLSGNCIDKVIGIREVMERMGVIKETGVMYVGDTIYDIRAAKLAGVIAAGITTGYMNSVRLLLEEPDHLFYSLTDIAKAYKTKEVINN